MLIISHHGRKFLQIDLDNYMYDLKTTKPSNGADNIWNSFFSTSAHFCFYIQIIWLTVIMLANAPSEESLLKLVKGMNPVN